MVEIESIYVRGFRRLNMDRPLQIPQGLTVIRGPNEAGKSTLIEAILFGLYGDPQIIRKYRKDSSATLDELINYGSREAIIQVTFQVGDQKYTIRRTLERTRTGHRHTARLTEQTEGIVATSITRVRSEVRRLVGVDWREMFAANVVAQKDLDHIINLGKRERTDIINLMMGLESFNKARQKIAEELSQLNSQLETDKKLLEEKKLRLQELEKREKQLQQLQEKAEKLEQQLPTEEEKLKKLEKQHEYINKLYSYLTEKTNLQKLIEQVENTIKQLQQTIQNLQNRIQQTTQQINQTETRITTLQQEEKRLTRTLSQKKETLSNLKEKANKLQEIINTINRLRDHEQNYTEQLTQTKAKIAQAQANAETFRKLKQQEQKLQKDLKSIKTPKTAYIGLAPIIAALAFITTNTTLALSLALLGITIMAGTYIYTLTKKSKIESQLSDIRAKIAEMAIVTQIPQLHQQVRELEEKLAKTKQQITQAQEQFKKAIQQIPPEHRPTSQDPQTAQKEYTEKLQQLENEKQEIQNQLTRTQTRLENDKKQLENLKKQLENDEQEHENLNKQLEQQLQTLKQNEEKLQKLQKPQQDVPIPELGAVDPDTLQPEDIKELLDEYSHKRNAQIAEVEKKRAELDTTKQTIQQIREELEQKPQLEQEVKQLEQRVKEAQKDIEAYERARKAIDEISQQRRARFAPAVERYMSEIIAYITDGHYKAVKINPENYDIQIYDAEAGKWLRRNIYSGGTNDQFLLAMRIAFTLALLPRTKGTYPKFLFLDEPLSSSDTQRRQKIIEYTANKLTKHFKQIILITHLENINPPNTTTITITNGKITHTTTNPPQENTET